MSVEFLNRGIWQRLFGIPATKEPENKKSWTYHSGELIVHLDCSPELKELDQQSGLKEESYLLECLSCLMKMNSSTPFITDVLILDTGDWIM